MKQIGVFLTEGFEEIEALTVVDLCRRAGILIHLISITGRKEVTGSHNITVMAESLLEETEFDSIDMIFLPGGPGTKSLEECNQLMEEVDRFYKNGKYIAAICAAPSILGHKGYLKGREACSYPTFESHLEGATVVKHPVVVSEFIITGRGMGCAMDFGLEIVKIFSGESKADEIAKAIVYEKE